MVESPTSTATRGQGGTRKAEEMGFTEWPVTYDSISLASGIHVEFKDEIAVTFYVTEPSKGEMVINW
jgi:hypothetical protein